MLVVSLMEVMPQDAQQRDDSNTNYAKWAGLGVEFIGVVTVFCAAGYWLDRRWNTSPWLLLAGFFIGFAGMFYNIWKQTRYLRGKTKD